MIIDMEQDDDHVYVIEQYMEGTSLRQMLNRHRLSETDFFKYIIRLSDILIYLHNLIPPVIHMDIKPENIIISDDNPTLIDFGCANNMNSGYGTLEYMAPERKLMKDAENKSFDSRTDIYSFGCLIEDMISASELSPYIEKSLKKLSFRCMADKRAYRVQNMKMVKSYLEKLQSKIKQKTQKPHKTARIAVAGTSENTGTTYISLLLAGYLKQKGNKCIYIENNNSGMVKATAEINMMDMPSERKYHMYGIDLIPSNWESYFDCHAMERFEYIISDFGKLTEDNLDDFSTADFRLLVSCGKPWEIGELKKALNLLEHGIYDGQVFCLLNHTGKKLLSGIRGLLSNEFINDHVMFKCMSYVPEIIFKNNSGKLKKEVGALFDEVLQQ